ncbi:hypothetical protein AMTRI_Chr10g5630 [Amborella trichopoda]
MAAEADPSSPFSNLNLDFPESFPILPDDLYPSDSNFNLESACEPSAASTMVEDAGPSSPFSNLNLGLPESFPIMSDDLYPYDFDFNLESAYGPHSSTFDYASKSDPSATSTMVAEAGPSSPFSNLNLGLPGSFPLLADDLFPYDSDLNFESACGPHSSTSDPSAASTMVAEAGPSSPFSNLNLGLLETFPILPDDLYPSYSDLNLESACALVVHILLLLVILPNLLCIVLCNKMSINYTL